MVGIIFWTLMIGFIIGAIFKFFTPQLNQGDLFTTMIIGLVGSVFCGWLGSALKLYKYGENIGLIASAIGAFSLLFIYHEYGRLKFRQSK